MEAHRALARRGTEFQAGSQRLYLELRCRPLMPMALDVVARLGLATDDAKATNFAGLCCLVTESAIAGAPRAIRKRRRLSKMVDELGGRIRPCTHEHAHPSRRCSGFLCEHLRWNLPFAISRLSLSTLRYRILRHPVDPALGARSHSSCRYWSRRSCNILL
jgi:hypothetical protein